MAITGFAICAHSSLVIEHCTLRPLICYCFSHISVVSHTGHCQVPCNTAEVQMLHMKYSRNRIFLLRAHCTDAACPAWEVAHRRCSVE